MEEVHLMQQLFLALLAGFIVGIIFAAIRLPIPAPPALAGVMGIIGIYLGYKVFEWVMTFITR